MKIIKLNCLNYAKLVFFFNYQDTFEKLCNMVVGLPHEVILNFFLFGLNDEIRMELAILLPCSISKAIGLAKLIESKIKDLKPKPFCPYTTTVTSINLSSTSNIKHVPNFSNTPKATFTLPTRRFTST